MTTPTDALDEDAASAPNLLDELDRALAQVDDGGPLAALVVPHNASGWDVFLAGRRPGWAAEVGAQVGDTLTALPLVREAQLDLAGNRLLLRLGDERIATLGAAMEGLDVEPFLGGDLAAGERMVFDFCDPNATKALHVGHLRNVALGNALGSLAASCGAEVVHQSQIADVGRQMGEAMAGYLEHFADATPETTGLKSDRLVGRCYSAYVADLAPPEVAGGGERDPALSREDGSYDDLAEQLLARRDAGEPEVMALWRKMRDWVVAGHDATLARLGIRIDHCVWESNYFEPTHRLTERALAEGIVRRSDDGAVVSHEREDGHLLLHRPDGFPTTHMRCVTMWHEDAPGLDGWTSVWILGDEWEGLMLHGLPILERLAGGRPVHPMHWVLHGMVTSGTRAIKSSSGETWLIDDLLDELAADERLRAHVHEHADAERLAVIAVIGLCIDFAPRKPLPMEPEMLLDERANVGWTLARAWARAWDPRFDGDPSPRPDDDGYRSLVLRSQLHRRLAERSLRDLDVRPLLALHEHAAAWFLAQEDPSPSVARAMRGLLECGLRALGLAPRPSASSHL